jgi:hypothetical protein
MTRINLFAISIAIVVGSSATVGGGGPVDHRASPRNADECINDAVRTLRHGMSVGEVDQKLAAVTIRRGSESMGGCGSFMRYYQLVGGKQVVVIFEGHAKGFPMFGVVPVELLAPWSDTVQLDAESSAEARMKTTRASDALDAGTIRRMLGRPIDAP